MNRRLKTILLMALFLISYGCGLLAFMPNAVAERWLRQHTDPWFAWQEYTLDWDGLHFANVSIVDTQGRPIADIENLTVLPRLSSLLGANPAGTITVLSSAGKLETQLDQDGERIVLNGELQIEELAELAALGPTSPLSNPLGGLASKLAGKFSLDVDRSFTQINSGQFDGRFEQASIMGLVFPNGLLAVKAQQNRLDANLSADGDLDVIGKFQTQLNLAQIAGSSMSGKLDVRPDADNPNGPSRRFLPQGKPLAIRISGTLGDFRWQIE